MIDPIKNIRHELVSPDRVNRAVQLLESGINHAEFNKKVRHLKKESFIPLVRKDA